MSPLMRPTKCPDIPVSLERNTEVFRQHFLVPTARLYELRGYVLLIGTGYDKCTCMHLAEYRTDCRPIRVDCAAAAEGEENRWRKYLDLALDNGEFEKIGAIMEKKGMVRKTMLNDCPISFFSAFDAIDEATEYFEKTVVYDLYR